jgi:hypothetical protein
MLNPLILAVGHRNGSFLVGEKSLDFPALVAHAERSSCEVVRGFLNVPKAQALELLLFSDDEGEYSVVLVDDGSFADGIWIDGDDLAKRGNHRVKKIIQTLLDYEAQEGPWAKS